MNSTHPKSKLLLFTDLDGCLLDHHDYSFEPAAILLRKLEGLHIPVIPTTSKTASELLSLRKVLSNAHPFISENGAAVFIPIGYFPVRPDDSQAIGDFWVKEFTQPRQHWLSLISRIHLNSDKFQTFADATVADIAHLTGLEQDAAIRASRRQYGEPVSWRGTDREREQFMAELQQLGANVLQGGRFLHVSGDCDKGKALSWLANQYKKALHKPVISVAIGDSQNDINMLEVADIAILIPSPTHALPRLNKPQQVYTASQQGPRGWAESVSMILHSLNVK